MIGVSSKAIRDWAASCLRRKGINERTICKLFGHSPSKTSINGVYGSGDLETMRRALDQLGSFMTEDKKKPHARGQVAANASSNCQVPSNKSVGWNEYRIKSLPPSTTHSVKSTRARSPNPKSTVEGFSFVETVLPMRGLTGPVNE